MSEHPRTTEFRAALVARMVNLMRQRRAPWQRPDRADLPVPVMPYNGIDGVDRVFRSSNAISLIEAMQRHNWTDPRFLTAAQAEAAGWHVRDPSTSGTDLIFWQGLKVQGQGLASRVAGEKPTAEIFRLYNAEEIVGMPKLETVEPGSSKVDMVAFAQAIGGQMERAQLLSSSALARRAAAQMLGPSSRDTEWSHSLRLQLTGFLFAREMGEYFRPAPEPVSQLPITEHLLSDPDEFFRAARDAQLMASEIVQLAKVQQAQQEPTVSTGAEATQSAKSPVRVQTAPNNPPAAASGAKNPSTDEPMRRIYLAVPFAEISQARAAGASWSKEDKAWWVPADSDLTKVDRWKVDGQPHNEKDVLSAFADAMTGYGLSCPSGHPKADGKWHYVPVKEAVGKRKQGSYILNTRGATPRGYIQNFKGASGPWQYEGTTGLSPEVLAAYRAQAREQAILRERELRQQQQEVAGRTEEVLNSLPVPKTVTHDYLKRKGVAAHGLWTCSDQEQMRQILNLPGFKTWGDTFLLVPGRDLDGNLLTVQAVAGRSGGPKLFTKDAAKSGAMHLLGATDIAELVKAPVVLLVEGYATGASLFEDLGKTLPVVVCFDAGNLVRVAKDLAKVLPSEQTKLICGDNDQFRVERALDQIREIMPELPKEPTAGASLQILAGEVAGMRNVFLGPVHADDRWYQTPLGKYRLGVESPETIRVDVVKTDTKKHTQLVLRNKGRECATEAAHILRGKVVLPEFVSLAGRPTDYNDLSQQEGAAAVQRLISNALGTKMPVAQHFTQAHQAVGVKR